MKLQIEIDIDGLQFKEDGRPELRRILLTLADNFKAIDKQVLLRNLNGNTVGFARLVESGDKCKESLRDQAVHYLHYTEEEREAGRTPKFFGEWTLDQVIKPIIEKD